MIGCPFAFWVPNGCLFYNHSNLLQFRVPFNDYYNKKLIKLQLIDTNFDNVCYTNNSLNFGGNMKNKFLSFVFAICFIVPCMFMLSACTITTNDTNKLTISINSELANGSIYLNKSVAEAGDTIKLMPVPNEGYELQLGSLKYNDTLIIDNTFIMPNKNVVITASFILIENPPQDTYSISVDNDIENGNITISKSFAEAGDVISLNITPEDGYELQEGSLKYNNTKILNNTFVMPKQSITITATFTKILYTINYHTDEYTVNSNPLTYSIGDTINLNAPTKNGYHFNGWYLNNILEGQEIERIANKKSNLNLYPSWTKIFDVNGDAISLNVYGRTLTEITIPEIIDGQTITRINKHGFYGSNLTEITLPNHIVMVVRF